MQPATDNQKFIDGSWYEEQYLNGHYRDEYLIKGTPKWAKECKTYYINRILMYTGLPLSTKILDLGASSGQSMRAWQERGFKDVHGIEISHIAVLHSSMPNLRQGTVQNMPYKDKEFDLVFSSALFEHIDESILDDVLKECFRISVTQAHCLCLDKGTDPSHVNIKTPNEWLAVFEKYTEDLAFIVSDELMDTGPLLIVLPEDKIPYPLGRKCAEDYAANNHDK